MDNEIFEMVTQSLTEDRISRIMNCDEEYQAAKLHERFVCTDYGINKSFRSYKHMVNFL